MYRVLLETIVVRVVPPIYKRVMLRLDCNAMFRMISRNSVDPAKLGLYDVSMFVLIVRCDHVQSSTASISPTAFPFNVIELQHVCNDIHNKTTGGIISQIPAGADEELPFCSDEIVGTLRSTLVRSMYLIEPDPRRTDTSSWNKTEECSTISTSLRVRLRFPTHALAIWDSSLDKAGN